jgi:hypothetical protein
VPVTTTGRAGLAANQIGSSLAVFSYNTCGRLGYVINPVVTEASAGWPDYVYVQVPWSSPGFGSPIRAWDELRQLGLDGQLLAGPFALLFAIVPVGVLFGLLASWRLIRRPGRAGHHRRPRRRGRHRQPEPRAADPAHPGASPPAPAGSAPAAVAARA